jgi:hypothetical protein
VKLARLHENLAPDITDLTAAFLQLRRHFETGSALAFGYSFGYSFVEVRRFELATPSMPSSTGFAELEWASDCSLEERVRFIRQHNSARLDVIQLLKD